jgi:hypothetical protein
MKKLFFLAIVVLFASFGFAFELIVPVITNTTGNGNYVFDFNTTDYSGLPVDATTKLEGWAVDNQLALFKPLVSCPKGTCNYSAINSTPRMSGWITKSNYTYIRSANWTFNVTLRQSQAITVARSGYIGFNVFKDCNGVFTRLFYTQSTTNVMVNSNTAFNISHLSSQPNYVLTGGCQVYIEYWLNTTTGFQVTTNKLEMWLLGAGAGTKSSVLFPIYPAGANMTASITSPQNITYYTSPINLTYIATSPVNTTFTCNASLDNHEVEYNTGYVNNTYYYLTPTITNGTHTFTVYCFDGLKNATASQFFTANTDALKDILDIIMDIDYEIDLVLSNQQYLNDSLDSINNTVYANSVKIDTLIAGLDSLNMTLQAMIADESASHTALNDSLNTIKNDTGYISGFMTPFNSTTYNIHTDTQNILTILDSLNVTLLNASINQLISQTYVIEGYLTTIQGITIAIAGNVTELINQVTNLTGMVQTLNITNDIIVINDSLNTIGATTSNTAVYTKYTVKTNNKKNAVFCLPQQYVDWCLVV